VDVAAASIEAADVQPYYELDCPVGG